MFQSTHSLRSATILFDYLNAHGAVSIHALLAECDLTPHVLMYARMSFNPRTPCGVRRVADVPRYASFIVSIHALLAECDYEHDQIDRIHICFNPRTPCGVRPVQGPMEIPHQKFQSTHSLRSATIIATTKQIKPIVSIHALLAECDLRFI